MDPRTDEPAGSSALGKNNPAYLGRLASWILGFGLVVFLSTNGGGHGVVLFGQVGIFAWLLLILGLLLSLFPIDRVDRKTWIAIGLMLGLTAWALVGMLWTDSPDKTLVEVARLSTYAAIFTLAVASRGKGALPDQIGAVAAGVSAIAGLALLSRFHPDLFPSAAETGRVLRSEAARLSYPLNYWNGLGALLAMGLPALLQVAAGAERLWARLLAIGATPIVVLAIYFTFSRGALLASVIAICAFLLLTTKRRDKLLASAVGIGGGLVLVLLAQSRPDIREGLLNEAAKGQGNEMMWLTIAVCLLTAAVGWAVLRLTSQLEVPAKLRLSRRTAGIGLAVAAVVLLIGLIAAGAPDKVSNGWESFKSPATPEQGSGRISAASGNGRYQLWASGLRQFGAYPIAGQGAGTFEYWWAEKGDRAGFIRDAHSLYVQTLGESGIVGFALLLGFIGLALVTGLSGASRSSNRQLEWTTPAVAGCLAFLISAGLDWVWQIPAVVAVFLLLAATLVTQTAEPLRHQRRSELAMPELKPRIVLGVMAVAGIVVLISPVGSALHLERSSNFVRQGDLQAALDAAQQAEAISLATAAPLIQEAGILESLGSTEEAIQKAHEATVAEPINWRNWLVLAAIEARAGHTAEALENFREAKRLNPRSTLLSP